MARKKMSDSLTKKKIENSKSISKEEKILEKLEGKPSAQKKLTVIIPEHLHKRLKTVCVERDITIKEIMIELIGSL